MATIEGLVTPSPKRDDPRLLADARAFYQAFSDLLRLVQFRDRDRACCYDVSVTQCCALEAVVDEGPLTVNELAARLLLEKSTVSRVADGLEGKGYLTRTRGVEDGRIVHLVATDSGRSLCARIESDLSRDYAELLGDFDPEVRSALTRLVGRLAKSFAARVDATGGSCCVVR